MKSEQISWILEIFLIQRPCLWIQISQYVKHREHYFNKFVMRTLDLKHWKRCIYIQAWRWETFCLQVQRWETDSNKFHRRETFAVSAGTCIPVKMKKKCRPQCLYMLKLVVISGIYTIQSLTLITDYKKVWWQSEYRRRGWWPLTQNMEVGRMKMRICQKEWCTAKETFLSRPAVSFRWLITTSPWWLWIQCIVLNIL